MKKIVTVLLLCVLSCTQILVAQSNRGGLQVKVVSPMIVAGALDIHVPLSPIPKNDPGSYNGKWKSMRLNAYDFSKWHEVRVDDSKILRFYAQPDATSKELGKVKLPSTSGKQLLFFMGSYETKKYRVFALKNSEVEWGEYGVFNSTSSPLMFQFDKSKKLAKSNQLTVLKPSKEIFEVRAFSNFDNNVKQINHSQWRITKEDREFIFCMQKPNSTKVRWVHVRDYKHNDSLQKS